MAHAYGNCNASLSEGAPSLLWSGPCLESLVGSGLARIPRVGCDDRGGVAAGGWGRERRRHRSASVWVMTLARMEGEEGGNTGSPGGDAAYINRDPGRGRPGRQGGGKVRSTGEAG